MFTHPLLTKLPPAKMTELVLSRRKLMEKIMQNVMTRKLQNSFQATGDRMSVTPQQFGAQVGNKIKKAFGFASSLPDAMAKARGQKALNPLETGMFRLMNPSLAKHIGDDRVLRNPAFPATPAPQMPAQPHHAAMFGGNIAAAQNRLSELNAQGFFGAKNQAMPQMPSNGILPAGRLSA